ncbi:hypothetical protein [Microcoleus sp. Pol11C3]|uniref:hypothetical protein n=1 Tax=Microcoleus sp. Pol11C3 TaxID=3055390 RepID=UPI002FD72808
MVRFMTRSLKIIIEESAEFLEKQLKNTRTAHQKERIQVLWWLKTGQVQQYSGQFLSSQSTIRQD